MADTKMADTKTSVVIKYSKPGTAPPIYLAGSFPESVWQPQEMEYTNESKDHYVFSKAVEVEVGKEYQYKFRIGNGDWWMSDEDAPIVTDEIGNRNNLLTVPIKTSPQTNSVSNEKALEENSTPRTLPDFDTNEAGMDFSTEQTQHAESGEKIPESSHSDPEVLPETTEETHDTSPLVAEAHATEPEQETPAKELDLSSVPIPTEELEVSSSGVDEPEHVESHAHPEIDKDLETTTTEADDLKSTVATEDAGNTPNTETDMNHDEAVEQEPVPIASEVLDLEKDSSVSESEAEEETRTNKDEFHDKQEESAHIAIEKLDSFQEPLASEGEAKEETDLTDSAILMDESTANVTEGSEKEVPQGSESAEEVLIEETDTVSEKEDTVSKPLEVEESIEDTTPVNEKTAHTDDSSKAIDVNETSAIETPADEATEVPEPNNEINSITKESPDQEPVEQNETEEPIDSTTTGKDEEQPSISTEALSAPLLTVEKVDSEPRHGDDFGTDATFAQKNAHNLHAQDAVPDQITIRQQASTPELADVAAEVADSAEMLDETPPTPPMSDKEAGTIGYRRLSHTPIPEVSETAAEVADTASQIDENFRPTVIELPTPQQELLSRGLDGLERDLDVETPSEERAPLFAHECSGPLTAEERLVYESAQMRSTVPEPMFRDFDPNDPSLEPFPSNLNQILEHVRRLENQLSEDQTDVEGNPLSPVTTNGNHHAEGVDLATPSPRSLAHEISPSLLPIVEEHAEGEPESKLTALPPSMDKSQSDGNISDERKTDSEIPESNLSSQLPEIRTSRSSSPQLPAIKLTQGSSKLHPILPALPQTPFVENKSLNLTGEAQTSPTEQGKDSPTITVQPATPAESTNVKVNDSDSKGNATKITSFADGTNDSQLRARKPTSSSVPERSITPSSMHSAGNDANSRNFLKAFFQVVFVDWIGGLIRKLCGGGRHTLVAVPALLIVVTAPILYLSGLTNFGFGLSS